MVKDKRLISVKEKVATKIRHTSERVGKRIRHTSQAIVRVARNSLESIKEFKKEHNSYGYKFSQLVQKVLI